MKEWAFFADCDGLCVSVSGSIVCSFWSKSWRICLVVCIRPRSIRSQHMGGASVLLQSHLPWGRTSFSVWLRPQHKLHTYTWREPFGQSNGMLLGNVCPHGGPKFSKWTDSLLQKAEACCLATVHGYRGLAHPEPDSTVTPPTRGQGPFLRLLGPAEHLLREGDWAGWKTHKIMVLTTSIYI